MTETMTRSRRLVVTDRDLQILHSLSEARYLTAQAVEWLHIPKRWQQWRPPPEASRPYRLSNNVYERLRRLEAANLVLQIKRPIALALGHYQRDQDLYALAADGAALLAEYGGIDPDALSYEEHRLRSALTLAHSAEVGRVYAALRAKIESVAGLHMENWRGEHRLAQAYDRLKVPIIQPGGGTRIESLPVQPDGTFRLIHPDGEVRCFIEVDRGRPIKTWRDKIAAYRVYSGSPELHARYKVRSFVLLTLTTTAQQRRLLMETTAAVLERPSDYYLFGLLATVQPDTIGTGWLKTTEVRMQSTAQQVGCAAKQVRIATAVHTFIH